MIYVTDRRKRKVRQDEMAAPQGTALPYAKAWRERRWLTQDDLAERAGVKRATVQRVERGGRVSAHTVRALAAALDVTPDTLCYVAPEMAETGV